MSSLTTLKLVPVRDLSQTCAVGDVLPLSEGQLTSGCWSMLGDRLVLDQASLTLIVDRSSLVLQDKVDSEGMTMLGIDEDGRIAIFSDDLSWDYQVYDLATRTWLDNDDPDFPRFTLDEDISGAWLVDLDTRIRYRLEELVPAGVRQSA